METSIRSFTAQRLEGSPNHRIIVAMIVVRYLAIAIMPAATGNNALAATNNLLAATVHRKSRTSKPTKPKPKETETYTCRTNNNP